MKLKGKSPKINETPWRNHHIYLKENSPETMRMTVGKHQQFHVKAYEYVYSKYGKDGIDEYLKWFDQKYGLEETR